MKTRVLRPFVAVGVALLLVAPALAAIADTDQPVAAVPSVAGTQSSASEPLSGPATTFNADPNYRVVAEDVLRLDVWGESQLSAMQFQVTPGGTINVPYLGEMEVAGLTQTQIADKIAKLLAEQDIVYDAKVQVSLITLHKPQVRVLGAVSRPGSWEF